jgi:hypothetical protein
MEDIRGQAERLGISLPSERKPPRPKKLPESEKPDEPRWHVNWSPDQLREIFALMALLADPRLADPRLEDVEEVCDRVLNLSPEGTWIESTDGLGRKVRWRPWGYVPPGVALNALSVDLQIPVAHLRRLRNAALRRAKEGR